MFLGRPEGLEVDGCEAEGGVGKEQGEGIYTWYLDLTVYFVYVVSISFLFYVLQCHLFVDDVHPCAWLFQVLPRKNA